MNSSARKRKKTYAPLIPSLALFASHWCWFVGFFFSLPNLRRLAGFFRRQKLHTERFSENETFVVFFAVFFMAAPCLACPRIRCNSLWRLAISVHMWAPLRSIVATPLKTPPKMSLT